MSTVQNVIDKHGDIPRQKQHLKLSTREDNTTPCLRCRACGRPITVNPSSGVEYGHTRKNECGGRCEFRPPSVDPNNDLRGRQ